MEVEVISMWEKALELMTDDEGCNRVKAEGLGELYSSVTFEAEGRGYWDVPGVRCPVGRCPVARCPVSGGPVSGPAINLLPKKFKFFSFFNLHFFIKGVYYSTKKKK